MSDTDTGTYVRLLGRRSVPNPSSGSDVDRPRRRAQVADALDLLVALDIRAANESGVSVEPQDIGFAILAEKARVLGRLLVVDDDPPSTFLTGDPF